MRIDLSDAQIQEVIDYLAGNPSAWRHSGYSFGVPQPENLTYRPSGWHFCFAPNRPSRQGNIGSQCFAPNVYAAGSAVVSDENAFGERQTYVFAETPFPPLNFMRESIAYLQLGGFGLAFPTARICTEQFYTQGQVVHPLRLSFVYEGQQNDIYAIDEDGHVWVMGNAPSVVDNLPQNLSGNTLGLGPGITGFRVLSDRRIRNGFTLVLGDSPDFTKVRFVKAGRARDCSFSAALADNGDLYIAGRIKNSSTGALLVDLSEAAFDGSSNLPYFKKWKSGVSDVSFSMSPVSLNVGLTYIKDGQINYIDTSPGTQVALGPIFDWITNESVSFSTFLPPALFRFVKGTNGRAYQIVSPTNASAANDSYWKAVPLTIDQSSAYTSNNSAGLQDAEWLKAYYGIDGYAWRLSGSLFLDGDPPDAPAPRRPRLASPRARPAQALTDEYVDFLTFTSDPDVGGAYFIKSDGTLWSGDSFGKGVLLISDPSAFAGYVQIGGDASFDKILSESRDSSVRNFSFGGLTVNSLVPMFFRRIGEQFDAEGNRINPLPPVNAN